MYAKSLVLHTYLFGVELTDTVIILSGDGTIYFLSSKKKIEFLQQLEDAAEGTESVLKPKFLTRNKADSNEENYQTMLEQIQKKMLKN